MKQIIEKIKQLITKNFGWKVLSLVLAAIIWTVIINADDPYEVKTFDEITVNILNEDAISSANKLYEIDEGRTISVTIRAPRSVLNNIKPSDIYASADLRQLSIVNAIPINVSLSKETLINSSLVEVEKCEPQVMMLTLEDLIETSVQVEAVSKGYVAENYNLVTVSANPNIIKISGSTRKISAIEKIIAEIDVSGASGSFSKTVPIIAYDAEGNEIDSQKIAFEVTEVEVSAVIYPTKELAINVTSSGEPAAGYRCTNITFLPQSITVSGTEEELSNVKDVLPITLDITGLNANAIKDIDVREWLEKAYPDYQLTVVGERNTIAVTATIEQLGYKEFYIQPENITFEGLAEGLSVVFKVSGNIRVRIVATSEVVNTIDRNNIKFYVNASGLLEGLHYVNIEAQSEENISVISSPVAVEIISSGASNY